MIQGRQYELREHAWPWATWVVWARDTHSETYLAVNMEYSFIFILPDQVIPDLRHHRETIIHRRGEPHTAMEVVESTVSETLNTLLPVFLIRIQIEERKRRKGQA